MDGCRFSSQACCLTLVRKRCRDGGLNSSKVLTHCTPPVPIWLAGGIGAVLPMFFLEGSSLVGFASCTFTSSKGDYSKWRMIVSPWFLHFHAYLYGLHLTLFPQTPLLAPARLQWWVWILSAYHYEIEFF